METSKRIVTIVMLALTLLLISSPFIGFSNSTASTVSVLGASTSEHVDPITGQPYGDIMQYDWPQSGHDSGNTRFSPGPGPNRPDTLWKFRRPPTGGSVSGGPPIAFDGKVFVYGGGRLYALDPFDGSIKWDVAMDGSPAGFGVGSIFQVDDTYLGYLTTTGPAIYKTANGEFVTRYTINSTVDDITNHVPGSIMYWVYFYYTEYKVIIAPSRTFTTNEPVAVAYDLSNPTDPYIKWKTKLPTPPEALGSGAGMVFFGGYGEGEIFALNATTGAIVWKNWKIGNAGYSVTVVDGKVIHSASSTRVTAYDLYDGTILWDKDAGTRAFFAFGGAAAYGLYFDKSMLPGLGYAGAWDVDDGELLWKTPAHYTITYQVPAVADGKVYLSLSDQAKGAQVAGAISPGYRFAAMDVFTGTILWDFPVNIALPMVAYGNVYGISGGTLYCIGESSREWNMWHNNDDLGVAKGGHAPADITTPKWAYKTDGPISGSPVTADGKVYFGSYDKNIYALDAKTGDFIWKYETDNRIRSTPAVVDGKVYIGPDDGYIYCLDAEDGTELWKTFAGAQTNVLYQPTWQPRSSPIVVDNRLYVGSMDGNLYCLSTGGTQIWKANLTTPAFGIGGSPAYANNTVYIASADGYINAVDATTGTLKWRTQATTQVSPPTFVSTPIVVNNMCLVTKNDFFAGQQLHGYDVTNGSRVMTTILTLATAAFSMTPAVITPTYHWNGSYGNVYLIEGMYVSQWTFINSTYLNRTWSQWTGRQTFSTPVLAEDISGLKIYFGSDVYTVFCMDGKTGATFSVFEPLAQTFGTAAIYEGRVYMGSFDTYLYCFEETNEACTDIWAVSSKGAKMLPNETVVISGGLRVPMTYIPPSNLTTITEDYYPPIPNAKILVTFTKPDQTLVNVTTTTNEKGLFSVSYTPTVVGDWHWMAWYEGKELPHISYTYSYSDWNALQVISEEEAPHEEEEEEGIPIEYIYAIVAVVAIVIIAIVGYLYMKSRKK